MGRKKKQTKTKEVQKVEGTQNINYSGKVTVSILRNNKTISSKTYCNMGRAPLFKFLCNCLAGKYYDTLRPCKIKLFNFTNTQVSPSNFNWENVDFDTYMEQVSPYITFDATPIIKGVNTDDDPTTIDKYQVTYHFRVPDAYLVRGQINIVALYSNDATGQKDAVAYYKLAENNEWAPIDFTNATGNFSLVIDWTLLLKNA